jgi:hypothetical protein
MVVLYAFAEEANARKVFETVKARLGTIELKIIVDELIESNVKSA